MLAVGIGALQIVLDKGQEDDWFVIAADHRCWPSSRAVTLVALVIHELTTDEPVVDLRVFKDAQLRRRRVPDDRLGFVLYGSMVLLPIMLQTLLGYPAAAGRHRDGAARHRIVLHDAARPA